MILESQQVYGIQVVKCVCDRCNEEGKINIDKIDLLQYFDSTYRGSVGKKFQNGKIFRWALNEYRQWKKTGQIDCPDCYGAHYWTEMR